MPGTPRKTPKTARQTRPRNPGRRKTTPTRDVAAQRGSGDPDAPECAAGHDPTSDHRHGCSWQPDLHRQPAIENKTSTGSVKWMLVCFGLPTVGRGPTLSPEHITFRVQLSSARKRSAAIHIEQFEARLFHSLKYWRHKLELHECPPWSGEDRRPNNLRKLLLSLNFLRHTCPYGLSLERSSQPPKAALQISPDSIRLRFINIPVKYSTVFDLFYAYICAWPISAACCRHFSQTWM